MNHEMQNILMEMSRVPMNFFRRLPILDTEKPTRDEEGRMEECTRIAGYLAREYPYISIPEESKPEALRILSEKVYEAIFRQP